MTPEKLLNWFGAAAGRDGYSAPMLDSPQAHHVAEVALEKLAAAVNLTRPEPPAPPPELAAAPARRPVDEHTIMLPIYEPGRVPTERGMP